MMEKYVVSLSLPEYNNINTKEGGTANGQQ